MWQHFGKSGCQLDLILECSRECSLQAAFISLLEDLAPVVWQTETAMGSVVRPTMGGYHNSEQFMARTPEKIVTNNGMEIPSGRLQKTQRCPAIGMEQGSWSLQKKGYIS